MQRRTFLAGTLAAGFAPSFTRRASAADAPPAKIKIGQIGTGHAHAGGKMDAIRSLADTYDVVGIVERYGTDSLAYFALRDDKEHFGFRDTLVAYRVQNGIALVSPDPIGPVGQRADAWNAFREFADEHGWNVAAMGANVQYVEREDFAATIVALSKPSFAVASGQVFKLA